MLVEIVTGYLGFRFWAESLPFQVALLCLALHLRLRFSEGLAERFRVLFCLLAVPEANCLIATATEGRELE